MLWLYAIGSYEELFPWGGIIFRNDRRVYRFILCQNNMMFPTVLLPPPPIFRLCIALFAVAEG